MNLYTYIIPVCLIFLHACSLSKEIDVDIAGFPARLSVTAIYDADSLSLYVAEGRSLSDYREWVADEAVTVSGTIELYKDGSPIWQKAETFDLYAGYDIGKVFTGLPVAEANSGYTLKINIDGYETLESTAIHPSPLVVNSAQMDITSRIPFSSYYRCYSLDGNGSGQQGYKRYYYPVHVQLTDDKNTDNYYSLQVFTSITYPDRDFEDRLNLNPVVFTADKALIRTCPDFEVQTYIFESSYELFGTEVMVVSDVSFAGSESDIFLYIDPEIFFQVYNSQYDSIKIEKQKNPDYTADVNCKEIRIHADMEILMKHISGETYRHYRNLVQQRQEIDFFNEPVAVYSNIENGYGCFSLSNSKRIHLLDEDLYLYVFGFRQYLF